MSLNVVYVRIDCEVFSVINLKCNLKVTNYHTLGSPLTTYINYMCHILAVGWRFPLGTPVSSTSENDISSSFHHLNMTLAVAEAISPKITKPNIDITLAVTETLSPNKPNLDMTLAVAEVLSPNKPNLDMTPAVAVVLSPNKQTKLTTYCSFLPTHN